MAWLKALPAARQRAVMDGLADELLFPLAQARMGAPFVRAAERIIIGRKRKPGGGRRPDVTRTVLASDVKRALLAVGVRAGRWRVDGQSSPLLEVAALCWQLATSPPGGRGILIRDQRRMTVTGRGWTLLPNRPMSLADRRWLRDLIS